jgi:PAS domain S-box-containing protein
MTLELAVTGASLLCQLVAVFLALRLIRLTRRRVAGLMILATVSLMAFRRSIALYRAVAGGPVKIDLVSEIVALVIAAMLLVGILYLTRLILELKVAAADLATSEERARTLVDASFEGIAVTEAGRVVDLSDQLAAMLGYARDELLGRPVSDFIAPEDRSLVQEAIAARNELPYENRLLRKDGTPIVVESRARHFTLKGRQLRVTAMRDVTERKRAERALRESEERFELALRGASDGLWDWNLSTDEVYYSPRWKSMLGYAPEELADRLDTWRRLVHPEDGDRTLAAVRDLLEGRSDKFEVEFRMQHKDGSTRHILSRAFLADDPVGRHRRLVGTHVDITERKQMELALQRSEQLYRNLVESTAAVAWEADCATQRFNYVSPRVEQLSGFPPEQWAGFASWAERIHPDDREAAVRFCKSETAKGLDHAFEYRMLTAAGGTVWVRDVVSVVTENGRPVTLRGYFIDITAAKLAEEKIRQSEQFIRGILDSVDEGFIVVDRDYRIATANKAYGEQVGLCCEDVVGKHCYRVSHRTQRPCHEAGEECAVREVFATGKPQKALHKHPDAEGRLLFVETKAYPILDAAGRVVSAIETITNITERHLLEEERLKTQKLESIGTLAGGIAHDFNNLLQGVFGYIAMAKLALAQPEHKSLAMLEQAEKALHLSVNLTSQLLTFSKGGQPVKQRVEIAPVVENAAKFALSGSRSDYRFVAAPGLWPVDADAGQIGQVIQNIVLNADQAMPLGGSVSIDACNVPAGSAAVPAGLEDGNYVRIAIADNGVGIPERFLAKIFDPYFTTKEKGSGLGLATSYSIVRNHGGRIEVRSAVDRGTTFLVFLAALPAADAARAPAAAASAARAGRFLVMDDEEIVRVVAGELLRALGHEVAFAEHGAAALERYRAARDAGRPFDAVILDLTIRGGMGGAEALRELKKLDPAVKAIVSSGYSDDAVVANHAALGFDSFLKKPYNLDELRRALDAVLA